MSVPKVSCLIAAYNVERWIERSIESALAQDWPAGRLEVIVVNDGSTDGTEAKIAPYRDRIRYVRKENGGLVSATNAGLEIATGDLICFLDGDDTWPLDRLRRQVPVLESRPELGLLHGDMTIVDEHGAVLHPSFFAHKRMDPPRGRVLGNLMHGNFVSAGGILVRASLRDRFFPISEACPYQDWYIASRVAEVAEIDHVDFSVYEYRFHGANESLGATGDAFVAAIRRDVPWLLWMQRNLDTSRVPVEDLVKAHQILLANASGVASHTGMEIAELMPPVGDDERGAARNESARAAEALTGGRVEEAVRALLRALAADPFDGTARESLAQAFGAYVRMPKLDARSFRILAFADELLEAPEMLAAYGETFAEGDDVTLVIQAPEHGIHEMAEGLAGAAEGASADLLLHPCDDPAVLLAAGLGAVYSRRPASGPLETLPHVAERDLGRVRQLVAR